MMAIDRKHSRYIAKVMRDIPVMGAKRSELKTDLLESLQERSLTEPNRTPEELMGSPSTVAKEYRANLNANGTIGFEYESAIKVLSWPLVHINLKPRGRARGVLAIGTVAIGGLSIGAFAIGIISIGALGIGLFAAIGAVAMSTAVSMGAVASSIGMSIGAVATANYYAVGAIANGNIAIGSIARGVVALYTDSGRGDFTMTLPAAKDDVRAIIMTAYPSLREAWVDFVCLLFR